MSGSATLHADGQAYRLEPGVFARVGPGVTRKITTGDEPVRLLAIGATPGAAVHRAGIHRGGRAAAGLGRGGPEPTSISAAMPRLVLLLGALRLAGIPEARHQQDQRDEDDLSPDPDEEVRAPLLR